MAEQTYNDSIIAEFRANGGVVSRPYPDSTLVLVTMFGAKSGREITLPLEFLEIDGVLHLFATAAGSARHPAWYHNVLAHPEVTVERGRETFPAVVRELHGQQRDRAWQLVIERKPRFADYERKTDRQIPVVALERR